MPQRPRHVGGAVVVPRLGAVLLFAHGIVGRADLPIPETLFAAAAAAVLVVSFVALALGWSEPKLQAMEGRPLFGIPRPVEVLCGALGVAVFFLAVWAGLFGTDTQSQNLAPTAVYVGFWVGIPFLSLLFGDVFRLFSPWRALGRLTGWVAGRFGALPEPLEYPARVGRIPAAAWLFAFAICELAWARGTQPGALAVLMLVYLVVMLVGMSLYGVEPWVRNADAFGVLFGLIGSLAPLGDGRLRGAVLRRRAARARRRDGGAADGRRSARPRSTGPRKARCSTTSPRACRTSSATSGWGSGSRSSSRS